MTAIDELRANQPGDAFLVLLQKTVRAVAVARGFPPPEDRRRWDEMSVSIAVMDFLADPRTPRRLTDLATHCATDDGLKRRLHATVQNFLADTGRHTPIGRLVLRFNEVLSTNGAFERRSRAWARPEMAAEPAAVDLDVLVAAAAAVEVTVPSAWTTGSRKSPDLDADSVVRLTAAMLDAAGGPLTTSVLAQATALRLGIGGASLSIEAAAYDPPEQFTASPDTTGVAALLDIRAAEVFSLLNDAQRVSIGLAEVPVARLGPILGISGSSAALVRKRAIVIMRDELDEEEDGQSVADAVLELARTWVQFWMPPKAPTY